MSDFAFPSPPPPGPDRKFVLGGHLSLTVLATAEETDDRHDLSDVVLPPFAGTPLHVHTRYEERIWTVEGALTVWCGEDTYTLRPGDYYRIPTNTPHTIQAGPDGARTLVVTSPGRFAELIRRTGTPAHLATPETTWDLELFQQVTDEFGDIVLGPPGAKPGDVPFARP